MVDSAPVSSLPPTLQARPPTPPRESNHNNTKPGLLGRIFPSSTSRRSSAPVPSTITPDSSAESPNTSGSLRKKVGFSDQAQYKDPPTISFDGKGVLKHAVQTLPPSAERKPSKSILKAHNVDRERELSGIEDLDTTLLPLHHYASFAKMLESIIQQLSGKDKSSKVDAYLMLSGSVKASDNVPDIKALKDRMGLICQYIERDLNQKLENGKPDSSLVVNALTVLGCFLHKAAIAECLPVDFTLRFVEHAIKVFEDGSMSKEVTKHLMFILAQQKFSSKVMSQERIGRLLMALHTIEQHMQGKSIVQGRLNIFRTLLRQSRNHMAVHTVWVEDLLTDMLSSLKDIRTIAITFGLEAGLNLGVEPNVSRTMQTIFKKEQPEGEKFADYYVDRLKTAIKNKVEPTTIPQIWSVVILFLRSKPQLLEQWQFFPSFLSVLSACFNIADNPTRIEAYYAWNRFIFAVRPNEKTSPKMRAMLFQGLSSQLLRKSSSGRKRTMSSIYTLLYYTLNPISTARELDMYWDEYVVPLVENFLVPSKSSAPVSDMSKLNAVEVCHILRCLFDTKTARNWTENRAIENLTQNSMDARELPALDSRWLRKNHVRVFGLLTPLLEKLYWDLGEDSAITKLWQSYITSIASPAVMEIKVSFDTMCCIASLFRVISKLCGNGPQILGVLSSSVPANKQAAFWRGFEVILTTAIQGLGIMPFTQKTLSIKHDSFIAVVTPSQQPSKIRLVTKSPLYHLISLLIRPSSLLSYDAGFTQMASSVLAPFFESKTSKQAQMDFVKEMIVLLPTDATPPVKSLWQVLADLAVKVTDLREKNPPNGSNDMPLGNDYRHMVNILETGILLSPQRPLPRWRVLFDALVVSAGLDAGESGKAIAVLVPLAKTLRSRASAPELGSGFMYLTILLGQLSYPKDRQALEAAERKMWGSKQPSAKGASYDPYNEVYICIRFCMETTYRTFAKSNTSNYADMISAVTGLLQRCPTQLKYAVLANLQFSIAPWIADQDSNLTGGNPLGLAVITLWTTLCKIIPTFSLSGSHTKLLSDFEALICAGLESKHKTIVNTAIGMWNNTFGDCEDGLDYPQNAKEALLKLHPVVDLQLPFFPESLETDAPSEGHRQPTNLFDPDESSQYSGFSSLESAVNGVFGPRTGTKALLQARPSIPQVIITNRRSDSLKRSREDTPDSSRRQSKRRDVTPRLRHNDSQAEFEAIPSSSPGFERVLDSQLLTERQKEVKERQQADAAMFPDLRSTPRARSRLPESEDAEQELPHHRSSSKIRERLSHSVERQTTPTAVMPSDDENNFVASSPTPTRSMRSQNADPPSSPPEAGTKMGSAVLDAQIASSPPEGTPEGTPEPTIPTSIDTSVLQQMQDPPSPTLENQPEPEDEAMEDLTAETTRTDMQGEDSIVDSAALVTVDDTTDFSMVEQTALDGDQNQIIEDEEVPSIQDDATSSTEAQVKSDDMQSDLILPTQDVPIPDRSSSPAEDPSDQLLASQLEHEATLASAESQSKDQGLSLLSIPQLIDSVPSPIAELALRPVHEPQIPGTPPRSTSAVDHSPKSPQFLDALTSPAGSDKHDHFEDALSSPRRNIANAARFHESSSSPLSDIDESSVLRIMTEYDQSYGRRVSFVGDKENEPRRTRSSMSKDTTPNTSPSVPVKKSAIRKRSSLSKSTQAEEVISPATEDMQTSSVPSLIPETPAPKTAHTTMANEVVYYDVDGVEVDMNEAIIVDTSILEREGGCLTHKRSPRKRGRKRKFLQDLTITNADIDSQDGSQDGTQSQSSTHVDLEADTSLSLPRSSVSPAKKKRRGGSSKSSQVNEEVQSSQDINRSQSFISEHGDMTIADTNTSMINESDNQGQVAVPKSDDVDMIDRSSFDEEMELATIPPNNASSGAETVPETTFEETSSAEKSSAASFESEEVRKESGILEVESATDTHNLESDAKALSGGIFPNELCKSVLCGDGICSGYDTALEAHKTTEQIMTSSHSSAIILSVDEELREMDNGSVAGPGGDEVDQLEEVKDLVVQDAGLRNPETNSGLDKPAVTAQSMKDKLRDLITDLHQAALSRREVNELEDMFMDAKRVLYDAELRGRQSADV